MLDSDRLRRVEVAQAEILRMLDQLSDRVFKIEQNLEVQANLRAEIGLLEAEIKIALTGLGELLNKDT